MTSAENGNGHHSSNARYYAETVNELIDVINSATFTRVSKWGVPIVLKLAAGRVPVSEKRLILNESVIIHMLADIDQIVTEHDGDPTQFTDEQWWLKLRRAVDGEDYKR